MNKIDFNLDYENKRLAREVKELQMYLTLDNVNLTRKAETIRASGDTIRDILTRIKTLEMLKET